MSLDIFCGFYSLNRIVMQYFNFEQLRQLLEEKYFQYNTPDFIRTDPIQIPHLFTRKEDIEISGLLSATIAWGNRKVIIRNGLRMMDIMSNEPYKFLIEATDDDIEGIENFVHRTFNVIDFRYFLRSLRNIYLNHGGLETVFTQGYKHGGTIREAIIHFRRIFFSLHGYPHRTERHVSCVSRGSAAKRINMFLMWMVRRDGRGVHFGLWRQISPRDLMLPLDVHTGNSARTLGLLTRRQSDWKAVEEVTNNLRVFDPSDPVKYDFALFGLDLEDKDYRKQLG